MIDVAHPRAGRTHYRAGPALTVLCWAAIALAALTIAVIAKAPWIVSIDRSWGTAALDVTRSHPGFESFWRVIAKVEHPDVFRALELAGALVLVVRRQWRTSAWLASVLVLGVLAPLFKSVVERPRPTWADPVTTIGGYSYPSGHASAGWIAALVLVVLALTTTTSTLLRVVVIFTGVVAATVVSLDRIFLGVHYVSDVTAGLLLAVVVVLLPWFVLVRRGGATACDDSSGSGQV